MLVYTPAKFTLNVMHNAANAINSVPAIAANLKASKMRKCLFLFFNSRTPTSIRQSKKVTFQYK